MPPFHLGDDRYERLRLISWWDQERLRAAKVLVVGAGALGNEVLKNLALVGVGELIVVDFDRIEDSNLARSVLFRRRDCGRSKADAAAEALADLNPDTRVRAVAGNIITDVGLGEFRRADVVIGCLDNREARLWVNRACWKTGTPWVDGGIQEISGVVKVFAPPASACYECGMTENDYRLINLRYSCPMLRREDLLAGKVPTAPTIASMIGGLQTQEALKLLHGLPVAAGQALVYNGESNNFYATAYQRREDCLSHETYGSIVELPLAASRHTARELFALVRDRCGLKGELTLALDRDLVTELRCAACDASERVMRPQQAVSLSQAACPRCGEPRKPVLAHEAREGAALAEEKLASLGAPAYDILRVESADQQAFIQLARED